MQFARNQIRNGQYVTDIEFNLAKFCFGLGTRAEDRAGSAAGAGKGLGRGWEGPGKGLERGCGWRQVKVRTEIC